jgi:hypothetical protein
MSAIGFSIPGDFFWCKEVNGMAKSSFQPLLIDSRVPPVHPHSLVLAFVVNSFLFAVVAAIVFWWQEQNEEETTWNTFYVNFIATFVGFVITRWVTGYGESLMDTNSLTTFWT